MTTRKTRGRPGGAAGIDEPTSASPLTPLGRSEGGDSAQAQVGPLPGEGVDGGRDVDPSVVRPVEQHGHRDRLGALRQGVGGVGEAWGVVVEEGGLAGDTAQPDAVAHRAHDVGVARLRSPWGDEQRRLAPSSPSSSVRWPHLTDHHTAERRTPSCATVRDGRERAARGARWPLILPLRPTSTGVWRTVP